MNARTIAAALAGLATGTFTLACNKTEADATTVPGEAADQGSADAAEHSCGNHAEGQCGGMAAAESDADAAHAATAKSFAIEPGKFAELNMKLKKGATVTAKFSGAAHGLDWNVHSHSHDGGTKIHDEGNAADGEISFTAPEDGVFSILWKNGGEAQSPLEVTVDLGEGAAIHSWMPD